MSRLTTRTEDGRVALKLENPKTEKEARKQLHDKFLLTIEKLARYEDLEEAAVDIGYLHDWYFASVTDAEPVWTEAHIEELAGDFILIPKKEIEAWNRRAGEQE